MQSTEDTYRKRSMDELAEHALRIITKQPGLRCGGIGDALFQDVAILRGSAPFARLAGKVMKKLEREGKAIWNSKGYGGWYAARPVPNTAMSVDEAREHIRSKKKPPTKPDTEIPF